MLYGSLDFLVMKFQYIYIYIYICSSIADHGGTDEILSWSMIESDRVASGLKHLR